MRRSLVLVLTFLFVFGFAGTTFANHAFDDVPANHWAYAAVNKLVNDGILRGYSNQNFKGDTVITRYEMAIIVANAMARADKASAEEQVILQKLKSEFGEELNDLGVHVFSLEQKADKLKMSVLGFSKVDWHDIKHTVSADKFQETGNRFESGVKIVVDTYYTVNDDWTAMVEGEYNRDWRTGLYASTKWNQCKELKAFGKIGDTKAMVGRFIDHPGEGVVFGDFITGMQVGLGDGGLKGPGGPAPLIALTTGAIDQYEGTHTDSLFSLASPKYNNMALAYALSPKTNVRVSYTKVFAGDGSVTGRNYFEYGVDTMLKNQILLTAAYAKSTYETNNIGWVLGVHYKFADIMKVGDYDCWVNFTRNDANASIASSFDANDGYHGARGYEIGYEFIPAKRIMFTLRYIDMKATRADDPWTDKWYRAQFMIFM